MDSLALALRRGNGWRRPIRSWWGPTTGASKCGHPDKDLAFPVHQILVTTYGIFLLENLDLDPLARDKVSEFAFVVLPLKLKGGTGSTVAPIAMK